MYQWTPTAGSKVFIDESKSGAYYIAAVAASSGDVHVIEKQLRSLRASGRNSIHFNREGDRRAQIVREMCQLDVRCAVYVMRRSSDREARTRLLEGLIVDLVQSGAHSLVLEKDASVETADRRIIQAKLSQLGAIGKLSYQHRRREDQPMLWVADAVAWCHQKRGSWPAKISEIVDGVVEFKRS